MLLHLGLYYILDFFTFRTLLRLGQLLHLGLQHLQLKQMPTLSRDVTPSHKKGGICVILEQ